MRPVAVVVDADACIPARIRADLGILIAPLDAPLLTADEPLQGLRRASAPYAAEAIAAACEQAARQAAAVLFLGGGESAEEANAAAVALDVPLRALEASAPLMGCGWQTVAAAVAARGGANLDDVERAAMAVGERVRVLLALEHPQLLGVAGGLGASLLRSRAIVELRGGEVEVLERVGRRDAALVHLRERFAEAASAGVGRLRVAVMHGASEAAAEAMARWVEHALHPEEVLIAPLTLHAAARYGPGMVGFAWYRDERA